MRVDSDTKISLFRIRRWKHIDMMDDLKIYNRLWMLKRKEVVFFAISAMQTS